MLSGHSSCAAFVFGDGIGSKLALFSKTSAFAILWWWCCTNIRSNITHRLCSMTKLMATCFWRLIFNVRVFTPKTEIAKIVKPTTGTNYNGQAVSVLYGCFKKKQNKKLKPLTKDVIWSLSLFPWAAENLHWSEQKSLVNHFNQFISVIRRVWNQRRHLWETIYWIVLWVFCLAHVLSDITWGARSQWCCSWAVWPGVFPLKLKLKSELKYASQAN